MCNLTSSQKDRINEKLGNFFFEKFPFTGRDIFQSTLHTFAPEKEVSAYVRELYNGGHFPSYWAAMKINGNDGPLLYFYVRKGTVARNVSEEIETNLKK